jgi:hypothetical protein
MKVFRLVSGLTYKVVGHDGPRNLNPGTLNTFPTSVAVQPGDVLGLNDANAATVSNACFFSAPGDSDIGSYTDLADGQQGAFISPFNSGRDNISAVVAFKASNADTLGKVKRNKSNGTATLAVNVPGPGTLSLTGKGVKTQRPAREASASKAVSGAGVVKLAIKPKGKAKSKLNKTGKAKVKVKVTYTPSANGSDVAGDPKTQTKRVKLIKKG